jgi:hypothetical protein
MIFVKQFQLATHHAMAIGIDPRSLQKLAARGIVRPAGALSDGSFYFTTRRMRIAIVSASSRTVSEFAPRKTNMRTCDDYPLTKGFSLARAVTEALQGNGAPPTLTTERERFYRIKQQFGAKATRSATPMPVVYAPWDAFKTRADVGGSTFTTFAKIQPQWTQSVVAHSQVYKAGATLLEGCKDQVILVGATQIPTAAFSAGTGTQQTLANSTLTAYSATVTVSSTPTLAVGMLVSAGSPGYLSPSTAIQQVVNSTTLLLNQPALQSSATTSLTFWTVADGTVTATTQSAPVFTGGNISGVSMIFHPLRMSFKINVSNQLLRQASSIWEPVIRDQIARGVSSTLDNLALFGTGPANGQLLGIFSAVRPINLGATPMTCANYTGYRAQIKKTDLDPDSFGLVMSPDFEGYLDSTAWATGTSLTLLDKIGKDIVYVGNEISTSTAMASGKGAFIGLWRHVYIMTFGDGVELTLDRFSMSDGFETVARVNLLANVGCTAPQSFIAVYQN